jgi:hypothetical protein
MAASVATFVLAVMAVNMVAADVSVNADAVAVTIVAAVADTAATAAVGAGVTYTSLNFCSFLG